MPFYMHAHTEPCRKGIKLTMITATQDLCSPVACIMADIKIRQPRWPLRRVFAVRARCEIWLNDQFAVASSCLRGDRANRVS